jgi:hypothetical protein
LQVGLDVQENAFRVDSVVLNRQLERSMLSYGSDYDLGRLGAEIAYTLAQKELGLRGLVISEPTRGGPDLHTEDGKVIVQARFLARTQSAIDRVQLLATLQSQLNEMNAQLKTGFAINHSANTGYVILTYLDRKNDISAIIIELFRH